MRYFTHQGARGGIAQGLQNLSGGGFDPTSAVRTRAYLDSSISGQRRDNAAAGLDEDRLNALGGLAEQLKRVAMPSGMTPEAYSSIVRSSSSSNPAQTMQGLQTGYENSAIAKALEAAAAGNFDQANQFNTLAKPGATYKPYSANDSGILQGATGALTPTDTSRARIGQMNAAAGASSAAAGASGALQGLRETQTRYPEVSPAASIVDLFPPGQAAPGGPGQHNAGRPQTIYTAPPNPTSGGNGPTTQSRKQSELEAQGLPSYIARGVAYGTVKQVTDARGNIVLVDYADGRIVGSLKTDSRTGQPRWEVAAQQPAAQGGAGSGAPPIPGAQQAPDGNWYVNQNGNWFRVD